MKGCDVNTKFVTVAQGPTMIVVCLEKGWVRHPTTRRIFGRLFSVYARDCARHHPTRGTSHRLRFSLFPASDLRGERLTRVPSHDASGFSAAWTRTKS
ncbi:hypothetical protein MRB53_012737 [Persea americana]|uniref:Uncharacterized protein n=1 Tax=Persea americana TaxID=3435 RepID=A0ACC2LYK1_PERAE|nr:hypothetical protein MRB53_012737 [Persea americana]